MSIDVDALKASVDLVGLVGHYVQLRKKGAEYVGLCVAHSDKNPSMWVQPQKGFVHCFSCDFHADAIDFLQHVEGIDFQEACRRLGAKTDWQPKIKAEPVEKAPERTSSKPPPGTPSPKFAIRSLGEPQFTYPIEDLDGSILGYECRYAGQNGGKEIRVWSWGSDGTKPARWAPRHFSEPRPLFGLPRLLEFPTKQVMVFEGPKKAEAGKRLLPGHPCISWLGGANAWHKYNWAPLAGRAVLLWPDADKPGWEACQKLAALLHDPDGLACKVRIVDTNRMPEGWDVADAEADGWDTMKLVEWAKDRASDYKPPEVVAPVPQPDAPQVQPIKKKPRLAVVDGNNALAPQAEDDPLPASMSEDMLADRFADQHAERWRYVRPWSTWFEWRGDGWYKDETGLVDRLAVEVTRRALYWSDAAVLTPDAKRRVNSKRTAGAVRDLAQSDRRIAATTDQWDTDLWLLGVPGGVIDLSNGEMRQGRPDDYITKRTAVAPADGPAPVWQAFLETVTAGNQDLISFLQRYAGYSLTGETREQCLAFLYGTGQNGKGVFITTIANILGDYAVTADADVFMESDQQRHSTEMARLRGARLVTVDETDSSKRWNEKRIKRITGGGRIEARFMRQDDFEFMPQFKLLIAGNHKPQLRGVGKAMQRRIHLVPFTVTIHDADRDDKLIEKLQAEYPQILAWIIQGCEAWREGGLQAPPEVIEATSKYIESEDVIGEWLDECCELKGEVARPVAYKNYRAWVESREERAWSTKAFWAALEERGFTLRKSVGTWFITGLSLKYTPSDAARYSPD